MQAECPLAAGRLNRQQELSQFATRGQCVESGSNAAQGLVVFGAQMVSTLLMAEFVDKQPDDIIRDTPLEPCRAQAQLVEHQLAGWTVRSCAKMMRR